MGVNQVIRRAVFLDRDGVLNANVFNPSTNEYESPLTPEQANLCQNAVPALALLQEAEYLLILVSNQPNYAKGKASLETLDAIHRKLFAPIEEAGVRFAAVHYCYHHPAGTISGYAGPCACRKPSPRFLLDDAARYGIDMGSSWMVGDRDADILCGKSAGVKTIRIAGHPFENTHCSLKADFDARDLLEAVLLILQNTA